MKNDHAPVRQASGVDPTTAGYRGRCDHCYLLHRPCRNGTTTTPCDRCREGGVLCKFSPHGSVVDKHVPGRRVRTGNGNCGSFLIGKFFNSSVSCVPFADSESNVATPDRGGVSSARQNPGVNDGQARERAVKVTASQGYKPEESKPNTFQEKRFIFFTQDQINSVDHASMHPGESLEARQKLAYELMDMHELDIAVEMKKDEDEK